MGTKSFRAALLLSSLAACVSEGGEGAAGGDPDPPDEPCVVPEGTDGSPETIEDVVELINSLPMPVTVACLVQALDRPLLVEATASTFSAQPAGGPDDPRIFIFRGDLLISIVTSGGRSGLVELAVRRSPSRSVKGEIVFPVERQLAPSVPYDEIRYTGGGPTKCSACHAEETRDLTITHAEAFESQILAPLDVELVDLAHIEEQHAACDPTVDPARCAMFDALLDHGEVRHLSFDDW